MNFLYRNVEAATLEVESQSDHCILKRTAISYLFINNDFPIVATHGDLSKTILPAAG